MQPLDFSDETKELLNEVVEYLPDVERRAVEAVFYDQMTHREAAAMMGMSPRQLRRCLHRAYDILRPLVLAVESDKDE